MAGKEATVVLGANYGDEGKGVLTDYLAARLAAGGVVVRHNGGAQAGHTVLAPDGRRHVFGHVGAGAFCAVPTFLSSHFVCNPLLFLREQQQLHALDVHPEVWVDAQAPVTTPYDMWINQVLEESRGRGRHGSCGVGFGETLERNLSPDFALVVAGLADRAALRELLRAIRDHYVPARLARLGLAAPQSSVAREVLSEGVLERFLADVEAFLGAVTVRDAAAATEGRDIIFEGAQGLLLDQDRGFFPHVTRSNTGLRNVLALAPALGIDHLHTVYVTRAYLTRHGAGPLPWEVPAPPYAGVVDATNLPNRYQGGLRFGLLDVDLLARSIGDDLGDAARAGIRTEHALAVTCLDQLGNAPVRYVQDGARHEAPVGLFLERAAAATRAGALYTISGPARGAVQTMARPVAGVVSSAA
jgi:adenylosuccinate synthase